MLSFNFSLTYMLSKSKEMVLFSFKTIGGGYPLAGIGINLVVEDCHSYLQLGTWTALTIEITFL